MNIRHKKILSALSILILCTIVFRFIALVVTHAVNLPIWDDFDSALHFMNNFLEAGSFSEKFRLTYEQHNEHRLTLNKVFTILSYYIFSEINFAYLLYIANLALLTLGLTLGSSSKEWKFTMLITAAIMLQPQYGDGLNWLTTSLASFALCMTVMYAGIQIKKPKINYPIVLLLVFLACFMQGNGLLLSICLFLTLLFEKRWKPALIIQIFGIFCICIFFIDYKTNPNGQKIGQLFSDLPHVLDYGFTLIGASLGFSNKLASMIIGIILTVLFLIVLIVPKLRHNSPLIPFLLFLFLSAAMNTSARGLSSTDYAISPGRYTILSSGVIASLAFIYYEYLRTLNLNIRFVFIPLALVFNLFSYKYYFSIVEDLYIKTINDLAFYYVTDKGLTYPWPDRGIPIFDKSIAKGVYKIPFDSMKMQKRVELDTKDFIESKKGFKYLVNRVENKKGKVLMEGWGFIRACPSTKTTTYINLVSPNDQITIEAMKKPRSDVEHRFNDMEHHSAGFFSMIPNEWLSKTEEYNMELLFQCDKLKFRQKTRFFLTHDTVAELNK